MIVVGTGMGGATLGYQLAKAGRRVLFCEKGQATGPLLKTLAGDYPEMLRDADSDCPMAQPVELLRRAGRNTDVLEVQSGKRAQRFMPFTGSGVGGSSALYGMALERFSPLDFEPRANHPHAAGASLEERWPVSYESMLPYYTAAEQLYRVRGTDDPLSPARRFGNALAAPPELTAGASDLFTFFQHRRLHPYRLPMACEFVADCHGCQGFLCDRECKNDSGRICIHPALTRFKARLLDRCEILKLDADRLHVNGVIGLVDGQTIRLKADLVVLAAGALQTPAILLRSVSPQWPQGVANGSRLVGRNLMRHFIDLYLVKPERPALPRFDNRFKELAFNDFYQIAGSKLGSVQSFGELPPCEMLFESLVEDVFDSRLRGFSPAVAWLRPLLLPVLKRLQTGFTALATTLEDLPYPDNRVFLPTSASDKTSSLGVHYQIHREGHERIRRIRRLMQELLKSRRWRRINQAENIQRIAHACGTCRFGNDPQTSVLDRNNRAHSLDNLYVVDSSFFPSSGGTNPSLTIAANALRVADYILQS